MFAVIIRTMNTTAFFLPAALAIWSIVFAVEADAITLAHNGATDYVIVSDLGQNEEVDLAVSELKYHLETATNATFPSISVAAGKVMTHRIIVGHNTLSYEILGFTVLFETEETLVIVCGDDLIIIGGEPRGTLYATYSFLENDVGCRWYVNYLEPVIPSYQTLTIGPLNRKETLAYEYSWGGFNKLAEPQENALWAMRNRMDEAQTVLGFENSLPKIGPIHGLFFYVPPYEHNSAWDHFNHPPGCNYFLTNPEYFSLSPGGYRVDNMQLCFSNPGLRMTCTSQIESVIAQSPYQQKAALVFAAMDVPGHFCHCQDCLDLKFHYNNIGGPYYDYVLELSKYLEVVHPGITIMILAYRKQQTEIPPQVQFPDNVMVRFAPIDDDFAKEMDHPNNQDTLKNLRNWCAIVKTVWVWYNVNPYIVAGPPFANIDKLITDMKLMLAAGADGLTFQQSTVTTDGIKGLNFADFQSWLALELAQDPDQDPAALKSEFMDYYFGPAAPMMATYIDELESARKQMSNTLPWNPTHPMFTYLTPSLIMKWENQFDWMEQVNFDSPIELRHVRTARITLDIAMLSKYIDIKKEYPAPGISAYQLHDRITQYAETEMQNRCMKGLEPLWWGFFPDKIDVMLNKWIKSRFDFINPAGSPARSGKQNPDGGSNHKHK